MTDKPTTSALPQDDAAPGAAVMTAEHWAQYRRGLVMSGASLRISRGTFSGDERPLSDGFPLEAVVQERRLPPSRALIHEAAARGALREWDVEFSLDNAGLAWDQLSVKQQLQRTRINVRIINALNGEPASVVIARWPRMPIPLQPKPERGSRVVADKAEKLRPIRADVKAMMAAPDWPERARQLIAEIREKNRNRRRRRS